MTNIKGAIQCNKDLFCGVNMVGNPEHMTDLEKKHLPVIAAPIKVKSGERFEIVVEVGKLMEHPNEPGHYIDFIELYADHTYLARMDLTACKTFPIMKVYALLKHTHGRLRAFAHCNLHGTWEGQTELEVVE
ncbi:MAG: desulfoferrodoxin family protein [Planctomycetota bacterium]